MTDISDATTFGQFVRAWRMPLLMYFPFRLLACVPPYVAMYTRNVPEENIEFGIGLVAYGFILSMAVALAYTLILPSHWVAHKGSADRRWLGLLTLAVGAVDAVGGLWAVYNSGGWGSPFWHMSLASLIVPCAVVGLRWSLAVAAAYLLMQACCLFAEGTRSVEVWFGPQRFLYVGSIFTVFFISVVVGFLGDICFELDRSRRRVNTALGNFGTMLEITQNLVVVTSGVNDLMRRVAQTVGERHRYDVVAIYLSEAGERELQLSGWLGEREDYERYAPQTDDIVREATASLDSQLLRDGSSWRAAIPIRGRESLMGVLVVGSDDSEADSGDATRLGWALVGQIAIGIQISRLRRRLTDAATSEEWDSLTREIHDGISGSMYGLKLHLETYAEQARREDNPLTRHLEDLVPPANELLLDTRSYIYHLLPALRGESRLFTLVENLSWEFEKVSEMPVSLSFSGDRTEDGKVPAHVVAGIYHVLRRRMAEVMRIGTASEFRVELHADPTNIRLTLSDDGVIDHPEDAESRRAIERIRRAAADIGGELRVGDSGGGRIVLDITMENLKAVERDQPGNS